MHFEDEFSDLASIEGSVKNLIADVFSKDIALLDEVENLYDIVVAVSIWQNEWLFDRNCYKTTVLESSLKKKLIKPDPKLKLDEDFKKQIGKLRNYHSFRKPINNLLPHQVGCLVITMQL